MVIFGYYLVVKYKNKSLWSLIKPEDAALGLCVYILFLPCHGMEVYSVPETSVAYSWPGFQPHNYFCFHRLLLQYKVNSIFIMILTAIVWTLLHFLLQLPDHTSGLGCPFSLLDIWGGLFLPLSIRAHVCSSFATNFLFLNHNFSTISDDSPWILSRADTFLVLRKALVLSLSCLPFSWIPVNCSRRTWFFQF